MSAIPADAVAPVAPTKSLRQRLGSLRYAARRAMRDICNLGDPANPLNRHLGLRLLRMEGHIAGPQAAYLLELIEKDAQLNRIAEVGFNAGHSSFLFLEARPDTRVVSFDNCAHDYTTRGKQLIDRRFPGRHRLVEGDSQTTVREFIELNESSFDLVLIDGGHSYYEAMGDLCAFHGAAHGDTLVIMDDVTPWLPWGVGPTRAWDTAIQAGMVEHLAWVQSGQQVGAVSPSCDQAFAIGRYLT